MDTDVQMPQQQSGTAEVQSQQPSGMPQQATDGPLHGGDDREAGRQGIVQMQGATGMAAQPSTVSGMDLDDITQRVSRLGTVSEADMPSVLSFGRRGRPSLWGVRGRDRRNTHI
jgi:hypothetical protein